MSRPAVISRIWEWSSVDSHQENQFIPLPPPPPPRGILCDGLYGVVVVQLESCELGFILWEC